MARARESEETNGGRGPGTAAPLARGARAELVGRAVGPIRSQRNRIFGEEPIQQPSRLVKGGHRAIYDDSRARYLRLEPLEVPLVMLELDNG